MPFPLLHLIDRRQPWGMETLSPHAGPIRHRCRPLYGARRRSGIQFLTRPIQSLPKMVPQYSPSEAAGVVSTARNIPPAQPTAAWQPFIRDALFQQRGSFSSLCLSLGSGQGCPLLRASDEHSFIVHVLRARRAPGRSLPHHSTTARCASTRDRSGLPPLFC